MNRSALVVLGAAIAGVLGPREAAAYIDPGTGSILLQLVLGGLAGLWLLVKLLRAKVGLMIRRCFRRPEGKDTAE